MSSVPDFFDNVKTVQSEAIRLTEMVIYRQVILKTIDRIRAEILMERITNQLCKFNVDLEVLLIYEQIEATITCQCCGGTGIQVFSNGADAGEFYAAMETIKQTCKCCGG